MKTKALAWALGGALTFALPAAPAWGWLETPEAIAQATDAATKARADMRKAFGKDSLKNGQHLWKGSGQVTRVVVSLEDQLAFAYDGSQLVGVSTISSGRDSHPTPTGIFPILAKKRMHHSIKYDNAPMPYMQRLDDYGIALHAGNLPGYPASHGCIRLPSAFAAKLFAATKVGTEVLIGA